MSVLVEKKGPAKRRCSEGMLNSYMQYAMYQESPSDFHLWCCISAIASAMGRQTWAGMGMFETFPCMYIILVGESAITHKSTAIKMAMKPFRAALPDVPSLSQKMSPESLINTMSALSKDEGGIGRGEAYLESSELSNLLGQSRMDDSLLKLLTEFWDAPEHFSYATLGRGVESVSDVCLNLLGGSTPSWLRNSVPESALEGGFFSRLILVSRPPKGEKNSRPRITADQREHLEDFKHDLACIRENMSGEFLVADDAMQLFDEWYHEHNHPEKATSFMRGYYGRKGDFLLKVAMCLSASFSDEMRITHDDMSTALRLLNENEQYTSGLVKYMGTTEAGGKYIRVKSVIKRSVVNAPEGDMSGYSKKQLRDGDYVEVTKRGIGHSDLIRKLSHQMLRTEIIDTVEGMIDSGEVQLQMIPPRSKKVYLWLGEVDDE